MHYILQISCLQHPAVLEEVRRYVDRDPAHRKLFVRGLGWDTTAETLKGVFSQSGEVDEAVIIRDKATQKSRGFGFVSFKHMDGALRALKEPSKRIDGRMTACQFASTSSSSTPCSSITPSINPPPPRPFIEDVSTRKIYVGSVPVGTSADKVLAIFSQFGEIAEGPLGFDRSTGASKGFALIIYRTSEGARKALLDPFKTIDGHQVHCKLAAEGLAKQQQIKHDQASMDHHHHQAMRPLMAPAIAHNTMKQAPHPLVNYHYAQAPPPSSRAGSYNYPAAFGGQAACQGQYYGIHPGYGVSYPASAVPVASVPSGYSGT
ncbi:UBP1-associated protein 2C [Selaginella moellendorffii]|uniref:UBP1-associated protein 2C n=1 Tax=Selaginella moellendorffii TaxID=88036 RepID=UPI000D1D0F91|nr:UBP1-associated protein 2C [Selaginella moellendorffii]|eukprot:XP_002960828.2 UBP1-associated protein 2C [Selaginella moellendorffii]